MSHLINVTTNDQNKPFYLDASKITGVIMSDNPDHSISFYSREGRVHGEEGFDAKVLADRFAAAGFPLLALPASDGIRMNGSGSPMLVQPTAVSYISSGDNRDWGGTLMMGVEGVGEIFRHHETAAQLHEFIDRIRESKWLPAVNEGKAVFHVLSGVTNIYVDPGAIVVAKSRAREGGLSEAEVSFRRCGNPLHLRPQTTLDEVSAMFNQLGQKDDLNVLRGAENDKKIGKLFENLTKSNKSLITGETGDGFYLLDAQSVKSVEPGVYKGADEATSHYMVLRYDGQLKKQAFGLSVRETLVHFTSETHLNAALKKITGPDDASMPAPQPLSPKA